MTIAQLIFWASVGFGCIAACAVVGLGLAFLSETDDAIE